MGLRASWAAVFGSYAQAEVREEKEADVQSEEERMTVQTAEQHHCSPGALPGQVWLQASLCRQLMDTMMYLK